MKTKLKSFKRKRKVALTASVIISFMLPILIISYLVILPAFPHFLFSKNVSKNNITIYYNDDFEKNQLLQIITQTNSKLEKSYFYNKKLKSDVFICNNTFLYVFLNPFNFRGFASNQVRWRHIFVANASPEKNISTPNFDQNRKESLTNLLAHEINHGFSKKFNEKKLKEWKEEGYAEYIAYDKNVDLKTEYNDSLNKNYWYIQRKCFVYYLLEIKKVKIDDFLKTDYDLEKLDLEIKLYLSKNKTPKTN